MTPRHRAVRCQPNRRSSAPVLSNAARTRASRSSSKTYGRSCIASMFHSLLSRHAMISIDSASVRPNRVVARGPRDRSPLHGVGHHRNRGARLRTPSALRQRHRLLKRSVRGRECSPSLRPPRSPSRRQQQPRRVPHPVRRRRHRRPRHRGAHVGVLRLLLAGVVERCPAAEHRRLHHARTTSRMHQPWLRATQKPRQQLM